MPKSVHLFYFFPLASIGGTESVHADVLDALQGYPSEIYIRYRANVWKGKKFVNSREGKKEGRAMLPIFLKYASVLFASDYLEAPRFGRIVRKLFIKRLAKKINRSSNPIVTFWHRESIEFLWPYLGSHVKIIDIVHNNSNNEFPDPKYLVNDWAARINHRVLVSEGLKKWIEPLYREANYPEEFHNRISIIPHMVNFPSDGYIEKPKNIFNVLFVGRDAIEKRFHLFLEIAWQMKTTNKQIHFHVVGLDPINYADQQFSNINWYGELTDRNEIDALYRDTHVLLLTSSSEGFPKVIAEAMAFSCIPLSTSVGGIPEVLQHESNALLTYPNNCVNESVKWIQELQQNKTYTQDLSKKAYFYAQQHFSPERFQHAWKKLISTLS